MPKRYNDQSQDEPPKVKISDSVLNGNNELKQGEILKDISGKQWKLGKPVGIGGFGEIYLASTEINRDVKSDTPFVAKIERHKNGPLFVEINCYLRIAKEEMINEWLHEKRLKYLGIPNCEAFGSHIYNGEKYRFLILPRFNQDLDSIFKTKKNFNLKTVLTISTQIMNVLEYIHNHGYVHSDIKASNIMIRCQSSKVRPVETIRSFPNLRQNKRSTRRPKLHSRNLRNVEHVNYVDDIPYLEEILKVFGQSLNGKKELDSILDEKNVGVDQIYLIDYGLASKYLLSNGQHREFSPDERKAHAGTLLFCSRDAHKGVPSRRSDLESLAYNIVYWLTGALPWEDDIEQPELVERKKIRCFREYKNFLSFCFNAECPKFLYDYFEYVNNLQFEGKPDYNYCRTLFKRATLDFGYKFDLRLDFDNLCGDGNAQTTVKKLCGRENKIIKRIDYLMTDSIRLPLQSNNVIYKRPKLRKQKKNQGVPNSIMNWSKILIDPEEIIKQARERKNTGCSDSGSGIAINLSSMDLESLKPTYAMLEVFNKYKGRSELNQKNKCEDYEEDKVENITGYTPAMMQIYLRMKENEEIERKQAVIQQRLSSKSCRNMVKTRSSKRLKQLESPKKVSSRNRIQSVAKKEAPSTKKMKGISLRRKYSLRG